MNPDPVREHAASELVDTPTSLRELVLLFFKLGVIGFGGPAAHIAMMEDEVVKRRRWLTRQHFLDLIGATNLIPGPNSTEMAIHIGRIRGGWPGLALAGTAFIFPAVLITLAFAWAYVRFGDLPEVQPLLFGIKPAVLAIILGAAWRLGKTAAKGWRLVLLGVGVFTAVLLGVSEILALLLGGVVGMIWLREAKKPDALREPRGPLPAWLPLPLLATFNPKALPSAWLAILGGLVGTGAALSLWALGLVFLKVGAVLYGSGYVLISLLEGELVQRLGWLTQAQLLDAIAIGQFTPGPVLTTATFIGYTLLGVPGAMVATVSIFLPSFLFVALLHPWVPRLRRSPWTAAFLDAVNVSAMALIWAVTVILMVGTLTTWPAWVIALAAAIATIRWNVNAVWIVLGGAAAGWLLIPWAP